MRYIRNILIMAVFGFIIFSSTSVSASNITNKSDVSTLKKTKYSLLDSKLNKVTVTDYMVFEGADSEGFSQEVHLFTTKYTGKAAEFQEEFFASNHIFLGTKNKILKRSDSPSLFMVIQDRRNGFDYVPAIYIVKNGILTNLVRSVVDGNGKKTYISGQNLKYVGKNKLKGKDYDRFKNTIETYDIKLDASKSKLIKSNVKVSKWM